MANLASLKRGIKKDLVDEAKAARSYEQREGEAKGTNIVGDLSEIEDDEKDHFRILTKALAGLKAVKSAKDE